MILEAWSIRTKQRELQIYKSKYITNLILINWWIGFIDCLTFSTRLFWNGCISLLVGK